MLYCELCNSEKDLILGCHTLFSEYNLICSHCLEKLMNEECKPSPLMFLIVKFMVLPLKVVMWLLNTSINSVKLKVKS